MAEVSRILVVDDDPDIREVLRLLLSESYLVAQAPDGLAAITYMKENPDTPVTELDSVEGTKGGKVLLTIHFEKAEMMLAFLRDPGVLEFNLKNWNLP